MSIEHSAAVDPNIHEPKGVSTATPGQVYIANGSSSGVWTDQFSTAIISQQTEVTGTSSVTQGPSVVDTPHQITFGPAVNGPSDPVQLDVNGLVTFNETGTYLVNIFLSFGRSGGAGTSEIFWRSLVNGMAVPSVVTGHVKVTSSDVVIPVTLVAIQPFLQGDTFAIEFIRDSSGNNSGNLISDTPLASGWAQSSSAFLSVQRLNVS